MAVEATIILIMIVVAVIALAILVDRNGLL